MADKCQRCGEQLDSRWTLLIDNSLTSLLGHNHVPSKCKICMQFYCPKCKRGPVCKNCINKVEDFKIRQLYEFFEGIYKVFTFIGVIAYFIALYFLLPLVLSRFPNESLIGNIFLIIGFLALLFISLLLIYWIVEIPLIVFIKKNMKQTAKS